MVAVVNHDGLTPFFSGDWTGAADLRAYIADIAASGAELEWCPGPCGGVFTHDTQIGEVWGQQVIDDELSWPRPGDEAASDTIRAMIAAGDDPLAVVVSECASLGVTLHGSVRMGHFRNDSIGNVLNGPIWRDNPGWRIDNGIDSSLDFAIADVRAYWVSIVQELIDAGIDNISLDWLRYPPFTTSTAAVTSTVASIRAIVPGILSARVSAADHIVDGLDIDAWDLDRLIVAEHGAGGYTFDIAPFQKAGRDLLFGEEVAGITGQIEPQELATRAVGHHAAAAGVHLFNLGLDVRAAHYVGTAEAAADLSEHTGQLVDPGHTSGARRFVHRHEVDGWTWDGEDIKNTGPSRGVFWNDDAGKHYTVSS